MTLQKIKQYLRNGKYAWPGGYPMFFISGDGDVLSFEAVREEWESIVRSHNHCFNSEWHIDGVDIDWEDPELYCDHTGKRIESAYAV